MTGHTMADFLGMDSLESECQEEILFREDLGCKM